MDAPAAEAQGQQEGQGGDVVDLRLGHMEQTCHDEGNQAHVQEGGCVAANAEIVGSDLTGLA